MTKIRDTFSNGVELFNAFKEDGNKVGEKTLIKGCEISGPIAGAKLFSIIGAKWGTKIFSLIPANPNPLVTKSLGFVAGGIIGGIVGGILGSIVWEKGGEFITDMKNEKKEDKDEEGIFHISFHPILD